MTKTEADEALTPLPEETIKSVADFRKYIQQMNEDMQKRREAKQRQRAKEQLCYYLDCLIFPILEVVAESFNEPLATGIARLIKEGKNPFRPKDEWNRTKDTETLLNNFLVMPQSKALLTLAKPLLRHNMEWVNQETTWILETVLKEEYPHIYTIIVNTEGGKEWFIDFITDFIKVLKKIAR